jgi:hypothetical protein
VASNDLSRPKARLTLSATIRSRFEVEPRVLELGQLPVGSDTVLVVTVAPRHPEGFRILGVEVNPPLATDPLGEDTRRAPGVERSSPPFAVVLRPPAAAAPEGGGGPWQLAIRLAPTAAPGRLDERIRVRTSDPLVPDFEIAVLGELTGALSFPERVEIASRFAGVPASATVPIRRLSGPAFRVLRASANDPHLRIEVVAIAAGEAYDLEITLLPDMPAGQHRPQLIVETDLPDQPRLVIDLLVRMGRGGHPGGGG